MGGTQDLSCACAPRRGWGKGTHRSSPDPGLRSADHISAQSSLSVMWPTVLPLPAVWVEGGMKGQTLTYSFTFFVFTAL